MGKPTEGTGQDCTGVCAQTGDPRGKRDSPCVALCSTLYDDECRGCGRTVMEVANWVFFSEEEKRQVWTRISSQGFPLKRD